MKIFKEDLIKFLKEELKYYKEIKLPVNFYIDKFKDDDIINNSTLFLKVLNLDTQEGLGWEGFQWEIRHLKDFYPHFLEMRYYGGYASREDNFKEISINNYIQWAMRKRIIELIDHLKSIQNED